MSAYTARSKIRKSKDKEPTVFEMEIAGYIHELEMSSTDKTELREVQISSAKRLELPGGKSAVVVFVPHNLLRQVHRAHARLVRDLEKKLSGTPVVIVADRVLLRPEARASRVARQKNPQSRSLTQVYQGILSDLIHPFEAVGQRTRYRIDGSRLYKVILAKKHEKAAEDKIATIAAVYKSLTSRDLAIEFAAE
jgi:small subunit ribosomal protein S7e|eukprot:TRINITY_DN927_c2_g1_i2.p1 TRINITY_DN927_c2_g1~~TRINITY_DN927_c2_g1_i2.p1  ORF type:complete len:221 (+),score=141.06 TRINITY_DN927_c2_g1_i2:84-665(+)